MHQTTRTKNWMRETAAFSRIRREGLFSMADFFGRTGQKTGRSGAGKRRRGAREERRGSRDSAGDVAGDAVLKRRGGAVQEAAGPAGSVLAAGPPCDDP